MKIIVFFVCPHVCLPPFVLVLYNQHGPAWLEHSEMVTPSFLSEYCDVGGDTQYRDKDRNNRHGITNHKILM